MVCGNLPFSIRLATMKSIGLLLIACLCSLTSFSQECPDSCKVFIPNNLTSDCDGVDCEILKITSNCTFKQMNFTLFNRWGEIIFETDDQNKPFNSHGYPAGTYLWRLKALSCKDKKMEYTGYVTIIL